MYSVFTGLSFQFMYNISLSSLITQYSSVCMFHKAKQSTFFCKVDLTNPSKYISLQLTHDIEFQKITNVHTEQFEK